MEDEDDSPPVSEQSQTEGAGPLVAPEQSTSGSVTLVGPTLPDVTEWLQRIQPQGSPEVTQIPPFPAGLNVNLNITSPYTQLAPEGGRNEINHNYHSPEHAVNPKLQRLLDESRIRIQCWISHEHNTFIETPAFKECQARLDGCGHVTLLGMSGDGKTSLGKGLLARELLSRSGRQVVIIKNIRDWKVIDLNVKQVLLFDDILGQFVLEKEKNRNWQEHFHGMYDIVRNNKIKMVFTFREVVFAADEEELGQYDLFKPDNIIHLSGSPDGNGTVGNYYCLDRNIKRNMIERYIKECSKFHITICPSKDEECLTEHGDQELKISVATLDAIAEIKTGLGFPQCCRVFVSNMNCFERGLGFFEKPLEVISIEIEQLLKSPNEVDRLNYCTLACVVVFGTLTDECIECIDDQSGHVGIKVKTVAETCGLLPLSISSYEIRKSAKSGNLPNGYALAISTIHMANTNSNIIL